MKMFLGLPKSNISCKITGNRVNRGEGNGLEIPCEYSAEGDRRTFLKGRFHLLCSTTLIAFELTHGLWEYYLRLVY